MTSRVTPTLSTSTKCKHNVGSREVNSPRTKHKAKVSRVSTKIHSQRKHSHKRQLCQHQLCDEIDFHQGMQEILQFLINFYRMISREYFQRFYPDSTSHPQARDIMASRLFMSLGELDMIFRQVRSSYFSDSKKNTKSNHSVCRLLPTLMTSKVGNYQTTKICRCSYALYFNHISKTTNPNKVDTLKSKILKKCQEERRRRLHRNEHFYLAIHRVDEAFTALSL